MTRLTQYPIPIRHKLRMRVIAAAGMTRLRCSEDFCFTIPMASNESCGCGVCNVAAGIQLLRRRVDFGREQADSLLRGPHRTGAARRRLQGGMEHGVASFQ